MSHQTKKPEETQQEELEIDQLLESTSSNGEEMANQGEEQEKFEREIDQLSLKKLIEGDGDLFDEIQQINSNAVRKLNAGKQKEALAILQNAQQILEFAASCGKSIDRNMIIVVLYNKACIYQGMWVLEQCSKYLDGVIYNIQLGLRESEKKDQEMSEIDSMTFRVQKQVFLVRTYLQYCAILSQLGMHENALQNAKKATDTLQKLLQTCHFFCQEKIKECQRPNSNTSSSHSSGQGGKTSKGKKMNTQTTESSISTENKSKIIKQDVSFMKIVCENSYQILNELYQLKPIEKLGEEQQQVHLNEAQKHLYFWKNNPENNEKHIRQELNLNQPAEEEEFRSILGVMNANEWIENFNIGSIMHMTPITYEEFALFGDLFFEISKRQLLQKIIFLSICYFTIATEIRFIQLDQNQQKEKQQTDIHALTSIQSEEFKQSQIFHLKAIEVSCQYVTCKCPYINHLITSYHKHYNQNLETINEQSFYSVISEQSKPHIHPRQLLEKDQNSIPNIINNNNNNNNNSKKTNLQSQNLIQNALTPNNAGNATQSNLPNQQNSENINTLNSNFTNNNNQPSNSLNNQANTNTNNFKQAIPNPPSSNNNSTNSNASVSSAINNSNPPANSGKRIFDPIVQQNNFNGSIHQQQGTTTPSNNQLPKGPSNHQQLPPQTTSPQSIANNSNKQNYNNLNNNNSVVPSGNHSNFTNQSSIINHNNNNHNNTNINTSNYNSNNLNNVNNNNRQQSVQTDAEEYSSHFVLNTLPNDLNNDKRVRPSMSPPNYLIQRNEQNRENLPDHQNYASNPISPRLPEREQVLTEATTFYKTQNNNPSVNSGPGAQNNFQYSILNQQSYNPNSQNSSQLKKNSVPTSKGISVNQSHNFNNISSSSNNSSSITNNLSHFISQVNNQLQPNDNFYQDFQNFLLERQSIAPTINTEESHDGAQGSSQSKAIDLKYLQMQKNISNLFSNNINSNNNNNNNHNSPHMGSPQPAHYQSQQQQQQPLQPNAFMSLQMQQQQQQQNLLMYQSNLQNQVMHYLDEQTLSPGIHSARTSTSQLHNLSPKEKNFNYTNYIPSTNMETHSAQNTTRKAAQSIGNPTSQTVTNLKGSKKFDVNPISPNNSQSNLDFGSQTDRPGRQNDSNKPQFLTQMNGVSHSQNASPPHSFYNNHSTHVRPDNQALLELYKRIEKGNMNKPMVQNFLKNESNVVNQQNSTQYDEYTTSVSQEHSNLQSRLSTETGTSATPQSQQFEMFLKNVNKVKKEISNKKYQLTSNVKNDKKNADIVNLNFNQPHFIDLNAVQYSPRTSNQNLNLNTPGYHSQQNQVSQQQKENNSFQNSNMNSNVRYS